MDKIQQKEIPIIEPAKDGYWEIYDDGRKIWHKDEFPSDYQPNWENDIEFPKDEIDLVNLELDAIARENKMKIKPPSEYVVPKIDIKDGEHIKLLDEGVYQKLPQDPSREVLTFKVELPSGDEKKMSINATSQKKLILAWGDDSKKWVGKKCLVNIVKQQVFDQMKDVIYLQPEEGTSSVKKEKIPE